MSLDPLREQPEAALLGCLILDGDQVEQIAAIVTPEDFEDPAHRAIFQALVELAKRQAPINFIIVAAELAAQNQGSHPDAQYLVELGGQAPLPSFVPHLARLVAERADARRAATTLRTAAADLDAFGPGRGQVYELLDALI